MKETWIGVFLVILVTHVIAAEEGRIWGGRAAGMGRASVALPGIWSISSNQAGMAWLEGWQTGLYAENRYLLKELGSEALAVSWSGGPGAFGLMVSYAGFRLYNEFRAGFSYARRFGKRFSAGAEIHFFRLQLAGGYGSRGVVSCELGWIYRPGDSWTLGMHICNPVPVRLTSDPPERLPVIFRLGAGWSLRDKVQLLVEGEKSQESPLIIRAGLEVCLAKLLRIRIGMHSGPFTATGGLGLTMGRLSVDLSTAYHTVLGFSPAISLDYSFPLRRK